MRFPFLALEAPKTKTFRTAAILLLGGAVGVAAALLSCVADEPDTISSQDGSTGDGASDGSTGDGSTADGSSFVDASAGSVSVGADQNPTAGNVDSTLAIHRATNEGSVTAYNLYWGTSGSDKLGELTTLPKTGSDLSYVVDASVPDGAAEYLLFTANTDGTESQAATAAVRDNYPIYIDITKTTDAGASVGAYSVAVDETNQKLDVTVFANPSSVVRCSLSDRTGSTCTSIPSSFTATNFTETSQALIDTTNGQLLLVDAISRQPLGSTLFVHRCGLTDTTGASCTTDNISSPTIAAQHPSAFLDSSGHLVVAFSDSNGDVNTARCNLGLPVGNCIYNQQGVASNLSAAFDSIGPYYDVAGVDIATHSPFFYKFSPSNLNGAAAFDAGVNQPSDCASATSLAIDTVNQKFLIVTEDDANNGLLALFRCDLEDETGASCAYVDISAGQVAGSGTSAQALIDVADKKLFVVATNSGNDSKLGLYRCELDGTACSYLDFSVGQGSSSGSLPSATIDTVNQRIYVVTDNGANADRPGVYSIGLW